MGGATSSHSPNVGAHSQDRFMTACCLRSRALGNSGMATELALIKGVKVSSYYLRFLISFVDRLIN